MTCDVTIVCHAEYLYLHMQDQVFSYSASVDQAAILDTRKRSVLNLDRHFKRTVTEFIINRYIINQYTNILI